MTSTRLTLNRFLAACCLLMAVSSAASAQIDQWGYWKNGVSEPWWFSTEEYTTKEAEEVVAKWDKLGEQPPSAGWAGTYFAGSDTHGTYLRWSPEGGFLIAGINKCQAKVMSVAHGRVLVSPNLIEFVAEFERQPAESHGHTHAPKKTETLLRFVPVRSHGGYLLVRESEMDRFGDYLAGLGEFNYTDFYYTDVTAFFAKSGDAESASQSGLEVIVPEPYQRFLKKPIEARITAVGKKTIKKPYSYENNDGSGGTYYDGATLTAVTISAGKDQGLKPGMYLRVAAPDEGDRVRITRVDKFTATGLLIRDLTDDGKETYFDSEADKPLPHSKIAVGWKLTTSPY